MPGSFVRAERGVVLVTALILMVVVLMIGASAARTALNDEKSARYERERKLALLAAEAALADAERDIEGGADPASERATLLASGSAAGFIEGCASDPVRLGLCGPGMPPAWQAVDLAGSLYPVVYGHFSGATLPAASALLSARAPRYLIELLPVPGAAASAGSFYRITAIGFGSNDAVRVVLQSIYRKASAAAPSPAAPLPAWRISWREVANWPELHQAAGN